MSTKLSNIQEILQKYAEVLGELLKIDVEITDTDLVRVAGSGRYKNKVGKDMSQEAVSISYTINTGEILVIEKPGEHIVCENCPKKDVCKEKFEMSVPIRYKSEVVGVIGFVCFTEKQKSNFIKNSVTYLQMIYEISELIAFKLEDQENYEQIKQMDDLLEKIIDVMNLGVIVYDNNKKIIQVNRYANRVLSLSKDSSKSENMIYETGNSIKDMVEYCIVSSGNTTYLLGESYSGLLNNQNNLVIFKAEDCSKIKLNINKNRFGIQRLLGTSPTVTKLKHQIEFAIKSEENIFLIGEEGSNRSFYAKIIHEESERFNKNFVYISCRTIQGEQLSKELFSENNLKIKGGTVFIDHINYMPLALQDKLCEVIKEKERNKKISKNFPLIISSASEDLQTLCQTNKFSWELYYKLQAVIINLPQIKDRTADIKVIITNSLINNAVPQTKIKKIPSDLWQALSNYQYERNDNELDYITKQIAIALKVNGTVGVDDINFKRFDNALHEEFNLEVIEKKTIEKALNVYGDNFKSKKIIAQKLGIGIATLYKKMKYYNISE